MKSLPSLLSIINTVLILALGLFLFFNSQKGEEKVDFVFIDNYKLFTGFNMSKELNAKYGKQIDAQKKKLDSIYLVYQSAAEFRNEEDMSRLQLQLLTCLQHAPLLYYILLPSHYLRFSPCHSIFTQNTAGARQLAA